MDKICFDVLLIEDNNADIELTRAALDESKLHVHLHVVKDGEQAMHFLHKQGDYQQAVTPDLILLDLNLPRKGGHEVLRQVKSEPTLKQLPVIVLTTSDFDEDVESSYELGANCYITKPVDFDQFEKVIQTIESFWFNVARLPDNQSD